MMKFDDQNCFIDLFLDSLLYVVSWAFLLLAFWTFGWIGCSCAWEVSTDDVFLKLTVEDLKQDY